MTKRELIENSSNRGEEIAEYKGIINCPCCGDKTFVKNDAHGQVTHRCKCGRLLKFDYDKMTAIPTSPIKGGSKYFNKEIRGRRLSR